MIDQINLAEAVDEQQLRVLGREAVENIEADDDSCRDWREVHARWLRQFHQKDTPVERPWEGSSEESVPLLAEGVVQFYSRASKALFPSNHRFVQARPVGKADQQARERAERVARHMNYQVMVQDKTYRRKKRKLLMALPMHGCMFTKLRPNNGRPFVENVNPVNLIVPYAIGDQEIETVDRKTHVQYYTKTRADALLASGFFIDEAQVMTGLVDDEYLEAQDDVSGMSEPANSDNGICRIYEHHARLVLDPDVGEAPYTIWVDATSKRVLRIAPSYFVADGQIVPIEYFTQYDYIPNPDGLYGLGLGHLIGEIQTASNKLLRMLIDSGELSTIGNMSGFINEAAGIPGGKMNLELGEFVKARVSGGFRDNIWQPQFPGPHPTLAEALRMQVERGDRLAMVTELLTGAADKVMQPTAVLALIEQGLEPFTAAMTNVIDSCGRELQKWYRVNQSVVDAKEYFVIQGDDGSLSEASVDGTDYNDDKQIVIYADPKQVTDQQKMAKAQALLEFGRTSPMVMQNPAALYAIERRYLEALGIEDIDGVYPAPHQVVPQRVDNPLMENAMALSPMPAMPAVFPDQDHIAHIQQHDALMNDSDYGGNLTPEGMTALKQHREQHLSFLYMMAEAQENLQNAQPVGPFGGQNGTGVVAPAGADPSVGGGAAPRAPGIDGGGANGPRVGQPLSGAGAASVNSTRTSLNGGQ